MVAESDREGLMRLEKSALEKHNTHFTFGNLWFTIIYKGIFFLVTVSLATIAFFLWWSLTLEFDRRVQGVGHNLIRKILIEAGQHKAMDNREVLPYVQTCRLRSEEAKEITSFSLGCSSSTTKKSIVYSNSTKKTGLRTSKLTSTCPTKMRVMPQRKKSKTEIGNL